MWFMRWMLCWIPSRRSLPPGVLCRHCAYMASQCLSQGTRTSSSSLPPNAQGHQRLPPPLCVGVVFARQLRRRLTILFASSESIYLPVPVLTISNDRHCLVLTISLTTPVPLHFNHCTHHTDRPYIHNYNRIIPNHTVQNNPTCCIQYTSQIMFYVTLLPRICREMR